MSPPSLGGAHNSTKQAHGDDKHNPRGDIHDVLSGRRYGIQSWALGGANVQCQMAEGDGWRAAVQVQVGGHMWAVSDHDKGGKC